jgi:hypothetical protein
MPQFKVIRVNAAIREAYEARLAKVARLREAIPRWHEVEQGGEIFGWKVPWRGISTVVPAPREIEDFVRDIDVAVLAALRGEEQR